MPKPPAGNGGERLVRWSQTVKVLSYNSMGEKGHLWLEFRPNPFSTFGDQVSPQAKKPRACQSTLRASRRVFSEPAQFPVLAKLLSSQPDVDDEMGFRRQLRRIVSFLSDLDDASDFLRAAVCFIRSTSSTRADRHNQLAARSATGGSTATAARASKCILALIRPACYPAQNSIRTNRFRGRTALIRTHARCQIGVGLSIMVP